MTAEVQKLSNFSKPRSVSPAGCQLKVFADYVFLNGSKREPERKILNRMGNKKHTRKGSAGTRCFDSHTRQWLGVWPQFPGFQTDPGRFRAGNLRSRRAITSQASCSSTRFQDTYSSESWSGIPWGALAPAAQRQSSNSSLHSSPPLALFRSPCGLQPDPPPRQPGPSRDAHRVSRCRRAPSRAIPLRPPKRGSGRCRCRRGMRSSAGMLPALPGRGIREQRERTPRAPLTSCTALRSLCCVSSISASTSRSISPRLAALRRPPPAAGRLSAAASAATSAATSARRRIPLVPLSLCCASAVPPLSLRCPFAVPPLPQPLRAQRRRAGPGRAGAEREERSGRTPQPPPEPPALGGEGC